ncbi:NAD-dependent deacetylase, putative [Trichomonas vaginalis G3]|uniref:NAD-dependent deacetylase, putative n=1 Tax=Trichomonas vaginalis (strain ATCC PRA-98 / G3) TaxID=412133 RepID=A2DKY6_TRIV3|nr:cellular response to caloric restriction [Trichomonas vaginalis G3]EAY18939.1 NAD-dependent deacetylase, putative [Trichomonas vaginalis G3]KAI5532005.1 cellular response to caloric restriction [Trichomonas vaginalis G3]|eukprot:XP_001579925.1 NAD-dependent deacetylase [Trichomonas vaginalis G3]
MPKQFFTHIREDFSKCDLLILSGTSLNVQPFASLVDLIQPTVPKFIINRRNYQQEKKQNFIINFIEKMINPYRDLLLISGDLQESSNEIVRRIGKKDEYLALKQELLYNSNRVRDPIFSQTLSKVSYNPTPSSTYVM